MNAPLVGSKMLLKDRFVRSGAAAVLLSLLLLGRLLFDFSAPWQDTKAGSRFTHMHCPECGDEVAFFPTLAQRPCINCGKASYVPTNGSVTEVAGAGGLWAKRIVFLFAAALLLQGLALLASRRYQQLQAAAKEDLLRKLICRCPHCQRKLSYAVEKVGHGAVCTKCKTAFSLPAGESITATL